MNAPVLRRRIVRPDLLCLEERCVPAVFTVTSTASEGVGTLRDALSQTVAGREDTILFAPAIAGSVIRLDPYHGLEIKAGVSIIGPEGTPLTIQGTSPQTAGPSSVITIETTESVNLKNLRLIGGLAGSGGGILDLNGSRLSITHCVIENNYANKGGGIAMVGNGGQLTIYDSAIRGNLAGLLGRGGIQGDGGGIFSSSAFVILQNTVVEFNEARSLGLGAAARSTGGGIHAESVLTIQGGSIRNNTVTANVEHIGNGTALGGGIYADGLLSVIDSDVSRNTAQVLTEPGGTVEGGGIYHQRGPLNITGSTLESNTAKFQPVSESLSRVGFATVRGGALATDLQGIYGFLGDNLILNNQILIQSNQIRGADLQGGGIAVLSEGSLTIRRTTFDGNVGINSLQAVPLEFSVIGGGALAVAPSAKVYIDSNDFQDNAILQDRSERSSQIFGSVRSVGGNSFFGFDFTEGTITLERGIDSFTV